MTGKLKKAIASLMAVASLSTCAVGISASAGWSTPYGTLTGSSTSGTWSTTNTPVFRTVTARSSVPNAAPYLYAAVEGYYNNAYVMGSSNTLQNATNCVASDMNANYANRTVSGNGIHSCWSTSYSRVNHYTYF